MSEDRRNTTELSVVERVLVEFEAFRKEAREARSEQAEQSGRVLGAVGVLSDRVAKIEATHTTLTNNYATLHEDVKRAREEAREAKQRASDAEHRAEAESRAVMIHVGKVQADVSKLREEVAENTTETQAQTPKLDALLAAANDAAVVDAWKKKQIGYLLTAGKVAGSIALLFGLFIGALRLLAWYATVRPH